MGIGGKMDHQIDGIPGFESRKVVVRSPGMFSGPQLLIDDEVVKGSWGKYALRRNDGKDVAARLVSNFIDPVPQLVVDGQTYTPIPPLPWYQLVWSGWPILLLFIGGFLGALFGALAAYSNTRVFRSNLHPALKYLITALISGAAIVLYLILAVILSLAING
jgi:hypothetical protein